MANRFLERLGGGPPIVADGGMGALVSSAVPRLRCPEEANLRAPDAVVSLHVGFINAGAELIETNSFGANRRKLAHYFLEDEFERINSTAVKLARDAREVTGREVFVAGSIGPLGEPLVSRERRRLFADQASVLEGRGADLFMVETFYDLDELVDAIEAVQSVSSLPIVALLTFDEGAETLAGVTAREAAERLARLDVAAIGANHGAGLLAALAALEQFQTDGLPLAALPNIGLASLAGGRVIFPHATPDYFAEFAAHARDLGARVIGGCCGTTPTEIAAIRAAVDEERAPRAALHFEERELVVALGEEQGESQLEQALRAGEWVVSAQLDPPLGSNVAGLIEVARALKESGRVGFVDLNDNAGARAGMSALIASAAIERACGVETIPHLTTRDTTVMGLESMLFGAQAEGLRNILAVTGDPPEVGDYPGSRGIYEVDSIGLTRLMASLNRGEDVNGRPIDAPTSFYIGVAVNPSADDLDFELDRFRQKIEAGAKFAMTQLVFDLDYLDRFLDRLGGSPPIPLLLGVCPLWSYRLALRFHNELPGIIVPDDLQDALRDAGADAADVGMAHAKRLLQEARDRVAGVYLVVPYRQPLRVLELLDA
jgi:methionine synthase I (cobalamin-dependent)/5,10-methylenetetrahydrofolate reductase